MIIISINLISCLKHWLSFQFILILQKVINDYYEITEGEMDINEILKISTQLLKISDWFYNYLKTSNDNEIIFEADKIEYIKVELAKKIDFLQNSQNTIENTKDQSERFFWSSIDNLNIIIENAENLRKLLSMSIFLELTFHKRLIVCKEEMINVKACILSNKWLTNETFQSESDQLLHNTVGGKFGKELSSKMKNWGIAIFNIENDLIKSLDKNDGQVISHRSVSLALTGFDKYIPRKLITYEQFNNLINLNFKLENTLKRNFINCLIRVPTKHCSNFEYEKSILVYRIDMTNVQQIFVTIINSTQDLRFTWLYDKRPDIKIMNNNIYTINITAGQKYEFTLVTFDKYQDKIHYIGISADMNQPIITQGNVSNVHFLMEMLVPKCLYWNGIKWTTKGIITGSETTYDNIHCQTNHVSLFSGLLSTVPNIMDPITEISHVETIENNMVCLILVVVVFIIYIILLGWSMYQDKKDVSRGEIIILNDNYFGEDEVYLVTVYTGNSLEAGTTANVCIQLHGKIGTSRAHWLYSADSDILQRFNDDWFILFTPTSLGEIQYIHIWHDNHGNSPDWYCKQIHVINVREKRKWIFNVERWFSILPTVDNIEQSIFAGSPNEAWQKQAKNNVELNIREDYLWASVFIRHPRSLITRCQRLSKILCLILSVMLISLMFYEIDENDEEQFLIFEFTLKQGFIALQSLIIQMLMTFGISFCFNKSAEYEKYVAVSDQIIEEKDDDNVLKKTLWGKMILMCVPKRLYLPARTEKMFIKNVRINYWLIIGWTLCIIVYLLSIVLIVGYGLKLGRVKSFHWLMSIIITIVQDAFFVEPLVIIMSSCALVKFNIVQNMITIYTMKLDNYRRNTKNQLRNLQLIRSIRESRDKYVYIPLTQKDARFLQYKRNYKMWHEHFKDNATTSMFLILTSLCCIGALHSFDSPRHVIQANHINKLLIKNLLQRDTVDLKMLKGFLTRSLIDLLHVKEYYSGIPISNVSKTHFDETKTIVGWHSLYNSKLINGGIRLVQNRIRADNWTNDVGYYKHGWINTKRKKKKTAWMYSPMIPVVKYYGPWFSKTHDSGFTLNLTGGLLECRQQLNTHLENGWLDNRTRNLVVGFQTYTPNVDCITVFKIHFQTTSGLMYTVNYAVSSVPTSSVFVSWTTYVFTLSFMLALGIAVIRLARSVSFMVYNYNVGRFWTAYECATLAVVLCAMSALAGRWRLMEQAAEQYGNSKETAFVASVTGMCQAHEHVSALVGSVGIVALVRLFRLTTYRERVLHVGRPPHPAGGPVAVVAAYALIIAFGTWYCATRVAVTAGGHGFFDVFVARRNTFDRRIPRWSEHAAIATAVTEFLFFNVLVVSIVTKYYLVSKNVSG